MKTLISTIVVLFIMAFLLFIGSLIRRYVDGLFSSTWREVGCPSVTQRYGVLRRDQYYVYHRGHNKAYKVTIIYRSYNFKV